ncbi:T-lymphocyte activation antigen CD80 isoform X2 [Suricata suricatta]|uniref:T-lymphocyte activation antigen CD80 isoform X2 n=1 Tax=Suricata suricatta TaxID=37032 RepID=UPI001155ACA3|nr:T-lymphocyte activation antigen CD80 isoform X2 [Suricata suricatta]
MGIQLAIELLSLWEGNPNRIGRSREADSHLVESEPKKVSKSTGGQISQSKEKKRNCSSAAEAMGHTAEWRMPLLKHPYLSLLQLLMLASLFHFCSGITQVNKTVKEAAVLSCDYNISTKELTEIRIYWQKDDEMVLAVMSGKVQVWPKYKNRTVTDVTENHSIVIMALRLSDNGKYTCIVQKVEKGSYKVKHLTSVMLLVRADFPAPSIIDLGNPSHNIKRIMCLTSGGFPKPQLSWSENEEKLNAINTTVSQDPETELFTISSVLDFNITNNHSFLCHVKYGNLIVSQIFNWQKYAIANYSSKRLKNKQCNYCS